MKEFRDSRFIITTSWLLVLVAVACSCCCDVTHAFQLAPSSSVVRVQLAAETTGATSGITISASSNSGEYLPPPEFGLYEVQEEMLVKRGKLEEELMEGNHRPLKAKKMRGVGQSKGFGGGGSGGGGSAFKQAGKIYAKELRKEGLARIDNVLTPDIADEMRNFAFDLRQDSEEQIQAGNVKRIERFADVLLRENRCDLTIPLGPKPVMNALNYLFVTNPVLKATIEEMLSEKAALYELSCLISDPGSNRQVVHPDNPYRDDMSDPVLLTCFIALQDIDLNMGPTVWIPRTHNSGKIHEQFQDEIVQDGEEECPKDQLLRTRPTVLGTLPKGSCVIYDSRLLHCGTANKSYETDNPQSRALFYFSFRNPKILNPGNPASIRQDLGRARLTMTELVTQVSP